MKLVFIAMGILLVLVAGWKVWASKSPLPKPTGSFAIGAISRRFENTAAKPPRSFTVHFWYPADVSSAGLPTRLHRAVKGMLGHVTVSGAPIAAGPHPLLLYFPGWGGEVTDNTSLLRDLASQGYVVAGIGYPQGADVPAAKTPMQFSSDAAFATGSAQGDRMVHVEAEDGSSTLTQLTTLNTHDPGGLFAGHLDLTKVAALGMSLGGSVAAQMALEDQRVRAVVNLDGWFFGDPARAHFPQPYIALRDGMPSPTEADLASHDEFLRHFSLLRAIDARHQDEQLAQHGGYHLFIAGTDHLNFCDKPMYGPAPLTGPIVPQRGMTIIQAYVTAFLDQQLEGKESSLLEGPSSAFPEVTLKSYPSR